MSDDGNDNVRWLDEEERRTWIGLGGLLNMLPAALDGQLQRDAGINTFEYHVLATLSEAPRWTMRLSDLAVLANGSLSRLSHGVKRLEKRGWVRREPCPDDGRATNAVLTDDGHAKVAATAPGHVDNVRHLVFDALTTAQQRQLTEICTRVLARIDPSGAPWIKTAK